MNAAFSIRPRVHHHPSELVSVTAFANTCPAKASAAEMSPTKVGRRPAPPSSVQLVSAVKLYTIVFQAIADRAATKQARPKFREDHK
jgi:hypothetical protein